MMFFRIGCASEDFNFQQNMIDFELLSSRKASMAVSRIGANFLDPEEVKEIQFVMCRMTPLTGESLGFIKFRLIGTGTIYFYGIEIFDMATRASFYFPVNSFIKETDTVKRLEPEDSSQLVEQGRLGPKIPLPKMTAMETTVIVYFIIWCTALCVHSGFEVVDNGLVALVMGVLGGIVAEALLVFLFVFGIKSYELRQKLWRGQSPLPFCFIYLTFIFVLGLTASIVLAAIALDLLMEEFLSRLIWTVIALIIVFGVWSLARTTKLLSRLTLSPKARKSGRTGLGESASISVQSSKSQTTSKIDSQIPSQIPARRRSAQRQEDKNDLDSLLSALDRQKQQQTESQSESQSRGSRKKRRYR